MSLVRVETAVVPRGESTAVRVILENRGTQPIAELRFDSLASESSTAAIVPRAWYLPADANRWTQGLSNHTKRSAFDLEPGDHLIHKLDLAPTGDPGSRITPSLVYRWRRGGSDRLLVVDVPEISVVSGRTWTLPWLLETLLLPLAVVALPFLIGIPIRRFQRRADIEDRAREEWRSVREKLLTSVHEAAAPYLGLGGRILRFELSFSSFVKARKPNTGPASAPSDAHDPLESAAFADLMMIFIADRGIRAWKFLDRQAEKQVATCWEVFRVQAEELLGRDELGRMIRLILLIDAESRRSQLIEIFERQSASLPLAAEDSTDLDAAVPLSPLEKRRRNRKRARARREADEAARALWQRLRRAFASSADAFSTQVVLLEILRRLLYLEVNRMDAPLYGDPDGYPGTEELPSVRELVERKARLGLAITAARGRIQKNLFERCPQLLTYVDQCEALLRDLEARVQPSGSRVAVKRNPRGSR